MRIPVKQPTIFWLGTLLSSGILHSFLRYDTFSLVPWPLFIAIVLAFTASYPWQLFVPLLVVAELLSSLPPGTLAVAMLIPILLARISHRPATDLSLLFFMYVVLTAATQVIWLILATTFANYGFTIPFTFQIIPSVAPLMALLTGVAAMVSIMLWQEWIAPLKETRTIPRYKQL